MYSVFFSHSSIDKEWIFWIADNAEAIGIEVYLYEHDPQPGKVIAEKIKNAIRDSDALLVLLSKNSQYTPYVHQEIGVAADNELLIIPLVEPGVDLRCLAMLEGHEYIEFDFKNPEEALLILLPHLKNLKQAKENTQMAILGLGALVALAWFASSGKK